MAMNGGSSMADNWYYFELGEQVVSKQHLQLSHVIHAFVSWRSVVLAQIVDKIGKQ
jgi:hypothetical protein